jgi:hypothetical protein
MNKVSNGTDNVKNVASNAVKNTMDTMKNAMDSAMAGNCYLIVVYLVCIIFLIIFSYSVYLRKEFSKAGSNIKEMDTVEKEDSGKYMETKSMDDSDYNQEGDYGKGTKFALIDYYIKGSYNSCGTGPAINGWVDPLALKSVIKRGVRFLDFEIYLKKNKAVVALQSMPYPAVSSKNLKKCHTCKFKDTLNELNIVTVLELVKREAIESGNCRNNTDPLILSFRVMSDNDTVYSILAHTIKKIFSRYLLPAKYGYCGIVKTGSNKKYTGNGKNIFENNVFYADLINLKQRVIIFAKGPPNNPQSYKKNRKFFELMNAGDNDGKLNYKSDYMVKNDYVETSTIEEHKDNYCVSYPDITTKKNSLAKMHFKRGCQAILMNFGAGYNDTQMKYYKKKFSDEQRAFILKPRNKRRKRIFVGKAAPQDPRLDPMQHECNMPVHGIDGKTFEMGNIPMAPDICKK